MSPRAVLQAFLKRVRDNNKESAAELLDLSGLPQEASANRGGDLAYRLFEVMRRLAPEEMAADWPPTDPQFFEGAPGDPDYAQPWPLSEWEGFEGELAQRITVSRGEDNRWRFSSDTVRDIEPLFNQTAEEEPDAPPPADVLTTKPFNVWYQDLFPKALHADDFLMPWYQWISLLVILVAGLLVDRVVRRLLTSLGDLLLHRYDPEYLGVTNEVWRPVGRLANAATWYYGAKVIGLPLPLGLLLVALKLLTILAAVWAAFAVTDLIADYLRRRAKRTVRKFDDLMLPVARVTAKIITVVAGVLAAAATFSADLPYTLIGGLGIGGIAIALASQETLSNFFGSLTVLFDRPFEAGDWVVVDGIEGEVESLGFRSTRIRTGLHSQVTVPNSKIAGAAIDNWGRRRYRRYLTRLGVEYGTSTDRVEAFCEGIRELIRRQPHTRKDFYAAYFNDFGASALEVLVVCYFETPDWATELRERHRLLLDIARLAERLEVAFAFPTQTLHLQRSESPSRPTPLDEPDKAGQAQAAKVAGELLNYQDRPGRVKFTGPTPVEDEDPA